MKKRMMSLMCAVIGAAMITACGGKNTPATPAVTTAAATEASKAKETEAPKTEETKAEETTAPVAETTAEAAPADGPFLNDGTVDGIYSVYEFMGMPILELAEMTGEDPREAAKMMQIEIKDGKATLIDEESGNTEADFKLDGENFTLSADGEELTGTLKDGKMTLDVEGEVIILGRLTDAAFEAPDRGEATVWTGSYTKFVGDPDDAKTEDEPFTLDLYEDGTGVHHRDELDLKVTWEQDGENFKMTETFLGSTIDYTGTMTDTELHLFNGDPSDDLTCEYVYTK